MPGFVAPDMPKEAYMSIPAGEFGTLCRELYNRNKRWLNEAVNDPLVKSVLVAPDGRIVKSTYDKRVLTPEQVRDEARIRGCILYQLIRPQSFLSLDLYFQDTDQDAVLKALERNRDRVKTYKEDVKTTKSQSGSLEKLRATFVLGGMRELMPLVGEKRYSEGATVVYSQTMDVFGGKRLHIASQAEAKIHERGARTSSDRQPDLWIRMERLHRFDDTVLDIYDTYAMERREGWPDLILYATEKNHSIAATHQ